MLLNDFLLRWKQNKSFPHCLIIKNNHYCNLLEIAKTYLKALTCTHLVFCDECKTCKRINSSAYVDFIYLKNDEESIKKEHIMQIQEQFCKDASEPEGIKLYVIKNIENTNKHVINSLLKFLEEPPMNTYALFFCKNEYKILPTIKSRSQVITINDELDLSFDADEQLKQLCQKVFCDADEFDAFIDKYDVAKIYDIAIKLTNQLGIVEELNVLKEIKLLSKYEIKILLMFLIEIVNVNQKRVMIELLSHINLNMNKNAFCYQIIKELK